MTGYRKTPCTDSDAARLIAFIEATWPHQPLSDDTARLLIADFRHWGDPAVWEQAIAHYRYLETQRFVPLPGELLAEWKRQNFGWRKAMSAAQWSDGVRELRGPSMSPAEFRDVLRAQSEQATEREKL